jgi:hypothetical protein
MSANIVDLVNHEVMSIITNTELVRLSLRIALVVVRKEDRNPSAYAK